jgi:hypothetical protein
MFRCKYMQHNILPKSIVRNQQGIRGAELGQRALVFCDLSPPGVIASRGENIA